tara:strand:- start:150 stop:1088 length:939 start_codon:yes stop_codon:yes gene_type:complete
MAEAKSVYDLSDLQDWETVTSQLDPPPLLAVIGDPVEHSASPQMHNPALKASGIHAEYVRIHLKPGELPEAVQLFQKHGFLGVNVTIPHKTEIAKLVDRIDPVAERIGAVNTLVFDAGEIAGFNSDAPGFRQAIRDEFSVDLHDLRIMILGAGGGAGRAVTIQCAIDQCERLVLVNRTVAKAEAIKEEVAADFQGDALIGPVERLEALPWDESLLADQLDHTDLIINATNLGMKRSDQEPLPARLIQPHHLVYDMVYSPPHTRFLDNAQSQGARFANGLSMLLWQGAISYEYWFNRDAPVDIMRKALKAATS